MKVRRSKPYVCVDCDFADHFRFQATKDLDAAAGAWLRCLAHSRAQEQDGRVTLAWLRRNFATSFDRIEELVKVGLLRARADADYEIHAYAPRNQTRAMLAADRSDARQRMRSVRKEAAARQTPSSPVTPNKGACSVEQGAPSAHSADTKEHARRAAPETSEGSRDVSKGSRGAPSLEACSTPSSSLLASSAQASPAEIANAVGEMDTALREEMEADVVRPNKPACSCAPERPNNAVTSALVPTSTSTSIFNSSSISSSDHLKATDLPSGTNVGGVQRGGRTPLPRSERGLSGPDWIAAFTEGISEVTGRPCTAGRMYLATLERIVTHHAPLRDAHSACAWIREQAQAFAQQWDGKHPPKGLTPDGLERWLNEGRQGPPEFGKRIVQLPAEEWHEDDWSDLGVTVLK